MALECDNFIKFFAASLDLLVIDKCSVSLEALTVTQLGFFRQGAGKIYSPVSHNFMSLDKKIAFQSEKNKSSGKIEQKRVPKSCWPVLYCEFCPGMLIAERTTEKRSVVKRLV